MESGITSVTDNANPAVEGAGRLAETSTDLPHNEYPHLDRPPLRKIDKYCQLECPCYINKRYIQAVLVMAGFIISFGIRCNVGAAVVKMMENQTISQFYWSPEAIWYVDHSFFWGYIITQVPGGFLASRFPANRLFGTAIFISSCLNLLIPTATKLSPILVIIVRFIQGLVEGVTYPSCFGIWRYWAPPLERSILATLSFAGSYGGVVLGMPTSWQLADRVGWYAPYYVYGCAGIIWYLFWLWLSFEKPATHPSISAREQTYIEQAIGDLKAVAPTIMTTPWLKVLSSMPVWAIIVANFARSWTFYILIMQPRYFNQIFRMNFYSGSIFLFLPHIVMMIIVPLGGLIADCFRQKNIISTTNVRKIFNCCGFGGEAVFLLVVGYTENLTIAGVALLMAAGSSGFTISGFNVNHLDIAPRYASILMGISNAVGTLAWIICPIIIQLIMEDYSTHAIIREQWEMLFQITSGINAFAVIFYGCFASGEIQYWAKAPCTLMKYKMDTPGEKPGNRYRYTAIPNVDASQRKEPTDIPNVNTSQYKEPTAIPNMDTSQCKEPMEPPPNYGTAIQR